MNVAGLALRHSRAIGLLAAALVVSGAIAALALPSGIYPPLQFPRIVIVAHSGTLPPQSMSLIVTRPIEQVDHGGARRASSPVEEHPRRIGDLRAVRSRDRHGRGAPDGPEPDRGDHRRSAAGHRRLQIERMTPEIFPVFILSLTGTLPTPQLYDYANFVLKPEMARVPGAGIIEVQASDTREIEVVLDPAKLAAADLTVVDVADALKAQNTIQPVGRFAESGLQHLALASGLWTNADQIAQAPVKITNGATIRVADIGTRHARLSRSHDARHRQRTRRGRDDDRAADRREHPEPESRRRRRPGQSRRVSCRPASGSPASTTSPSSSKNRSRASATPS